MTRALMAILVVVSLVSHAAAGRAAGADSVLFREDFEGSIDKLWDEQGFPSIERKNIFSLAVEPNGNHYLKAYSSRSASGKGIRLTFSPRRCPTVSWRWMISSTVAAADIRRKDADDAAAKLYIVLDGPSRWNPFDKRILVYVWDNAAPVGAVLPNTWLPEKERMVVLESGESQVGKWISEDVRLADDFVRAFAGENPGRVEAMAFMTDTDNTSSEVSAGFDDLVIRCLPSGEDMRDR